jgi:hypothetical protein
MNVSPGAVYLSSLILFGLTIVANGLSKLVTTDRLLWPVYVVAGTVLVVTAAFRWRRGFDPEPGWLAYAAATGAVVYTLVSVSRLL